MYLRENLPHKDKHLKNKTSDNNKKKTIES